ncbi:MAG: 2-hydroxyacid dehydrogenase [Bacteroidia bacterium]|nr:MAG: 2-hydroxyacid dehydrogenase [Bacteroidia bacterium]
MLKLEIKLFYFDIVKIALIDFFEEYLLNQLKLNHFNYFYFPDSSRQDLLKPNDYEILILKSKTFIDDEFLSYWKNLRYIIRAGAGVDHIDLPLLEQKNILLITTNEGNANAVAEHAMGLLLALMNNIPKANKEVKNFQWIREANRGYEIEGKTIGIIGYGNTGSAFAKKLKGFECQVLAFDKYKTGFSHQNVQETDLLTLQNKADIISFHVPLTKETYYYFDENFVNNLKKPIWLLNLSRGPIVKTCILPELLASKKILGCGLDVLEYEDFNKLPTEYKNILEKLYLYDNCIFTPHIGGWSFESAKKINNLVIKKIIRN